MSELRDTNVRESLFLGYSNLNVVTLLVRLGLDVTITGNFKLNSIYADDSDKLAQYFKKFEEKEMLAKFRNKPVNMPFYLVDLYYYDTNGSIICINEEIIKLEVAKRWSETHVES